MTDTSTAPGRVPDFFIAGHPKCGTTALFRMLRAHPDIYIPLKESRYFTPEMRSRFRRLIPNELPETLDSYLAMFARARPDQLTGEASPSYLRSQTAAARIAQVAPNAKIVAVFREPVSFLRSFHQQILRSMIETEKDFARALALEGDRRAGRHVPLLSQAPKTLYYSDHVRYAEQLRRFHEAFSREQVLALVYDDLRADTEGTLRSVLRFLGVDDTVAIEPTRTSGSRAVRSLTLHQLGRAYALTQRRRGVPSRQGPSPNPAVRAFKTGWNRLVYTDVAPLDPQVELQLRRRFAGEVHALSEYLDRDLVTLWGYEDL